MSNTRFVAGDLRRSDNSVRRLKLPSYLAQEFDSSLCFFGRKTGMNWEVYDLTCRLFGNPTLALPISEAAWRCLDGVKR
jgi:hypothetical protein